MIRSDAFNYVNILDKAADASWMRESAIANNIANVDTPGYKREDIEFATVLKGALSDVRYRDLDQAVRGVNEDIASLKGISYYDYAGFDYRIDGNNVDVDTENVELASEQLKYQALTTSISAEFSRFSTVIK